MSLLTTEIHLGSETDALLWAALRSVVSSSGGLIAELSHDVAGSQELVQYAVTLPGGTVDVVSETYIGLTLRGSSPLVDELSHAIQTAYRSAA